ncbi:MAG: FUSC family protein [Sulfuritalea sp.]|nr:FUSC family protein [Sulfuritalea sp.]MDP1983926.1 FUSC family protein [Sulfuritalea sp.]
MPILTNLMLAQRSGEAAGRALYWSTLGSFLGSVTLSLVVMQLFGVWAAVLLGAALLLAGAALVQRPQALTAALLLAVAGLSVAANLGDRQRADTAYADYEVETVVREDMQSPRSFWNLASRFLRRRSSAPCPVKRMRAHPAANARLPDRRRHSARPCGPAAADAGYPAPA